jgi:signal peptidase II
MRMKGKLRFLILAALCIALDLGTKELFFHLTRSDVAGGRDNRIQVIDTSFLKFDIHKIENPGGMFGIGRGYGDILRYLRLGAFALVVYFWLRAKPHQKLFLTSLSLIFAGAVGNLYDSFFNGGRVRDFLEFYLLFMPKSIFKNLFDPWPTFNVADSLILIGAALLVLQLFRDPELGGKKKKKSASASMADKEPA